MITELLKTGEQNAVTAAELADQLQTSRREVFAMVEKARDSGAPVCASGKGIFLAESPDELSVYYERARRRVLKELRTLRHIRLMAQQIRGQEEL